MKKISWIIGIDEVGRGPLAGPVSVCACVLPYHTSVKESYKKFLKTYTKEIKGLPKIHMKDSKKLSATERDGWKKFLSTTHAKFIYAEATAKDIDKKGIAVCIRNLIDVVLKNEKDCLILLDGGLKAKDTFTNQKTIIKGDEKEMVISFASIYAKVTRDEYMKKASKKFSLYGFDIHKGYGTKMHRELIQKHGLSSLHRKSFCSRIANI